MADLRCLRVELQPEQRLHELTPVQSSRWRFTQKQPLHGSQLWGGHACRHRHVGFAGVAAAVGCIRLALQQVLQ